MVRTVHDISEGYSARTIEVRAYGDPVPAPTQHFFAGKMVGKPRSGYREWVARLEEQFKLERERIKVMPLHKLEWRKLEVIVMMQTKHKAKWGRPRHECRTPALSYAEPVIKALEVALLWDGSQKANDIRVRRVYAPVGGVMVRIGVQQELLEFSIL